MPNHDRLTERDDHYGAVALGEMAGLDARESPLIAEGRE
jgi:hypothetical protein